MELVGNNFINCRSYFWNGFQILGKGTRGTGNQRKNQEHPGYSIVKISQNREESKRFKETCHSESSEISPTVTCMKNMEGSVQENETHKLLFDFDIQTDHLVLGRRPDLIIKKTKKKQKKKLANLWTLLPRLIIE